MKQVKKNIDFCYSILMMESSVKKGPSELQSFHVGDPNALLQTTKEIQ